MKQKKIVKTLRENGNAGASIEFSKRELRMMGLKSGDSVVDEKFKTLWMMINNK